MRCKNKAQNVRKRIFHKFYNLLPKGNEMMITLNWMSDDESTVVPS